MIKSILNIKGIVLAIVSLFLVSLVVGQGYVIQDTDRPSVDEDVTFFELDLEFQPNVVEEGDIVVLTARDLGSGDTLEGVDIYIDDEYVGETDSTGSYRFSLEEPGDYHVEGVFGGYYETEETLEVLAPVEERYHVSGSSSMSGNFFVHSSNLELLVYFLLVAAFVGGYLQHSGRLTIFKFVE